MSLLITRGLGEVAFIPVYATAIGGGVPEIQSASSVDPELASLGENLPRVLAQEPSPVISTRHIESGKIQSTNLRPTLVSLGESED